MRVVRGFWFWDKNLLTTGFRQKLLIAAESQTELLDILGMGVDLLTTGFRPELLTAAR